VQRQQLKKAQWQHRGKEASSCARDIFPQGRVECAAKKVFVDGCGES
jgi:hypothetical protein